MKKFYLKLKGHTDIWEVEASSLKHAKQIVANYIWTQYGDDPDYTIKKLKEIDKNTPHEEINVL